MYSPLPPLRGGRGEVKRFIEYEKETIYQSSF